MSKLKLRSLPSPHSFGFLGIDESLPIPTLEHDMFNCPTSVHYAYVLGHFVGSSFRVISCHHLPDDARIARKRDSLLHPGRSYLIVHLNISLTAYV